MGCAGAKWTAEMLPMVDYLVGSIFPKGKEVYVICTESTDIRGQDDGFLLNLTPKTQWIYHGHPPESLQHLLFI